MTKKAPFGDDINKIPKWRFRFLDLKYVSKLKFPLFLEFLAVLIYGTKQIVLTSHSQEPLQSSLLAADFIMRCEINGLSLSLSHFPL